MTRRILHLYADLGVEDEVLHTFGEVVRVGIDPEPNPFSEVVQADAQDPPLAGGFDLAVVHYPCQRWSRSTENGGGDPEAWPDDLGEARRVARELAEHYILENVPEAPLRDPVLLEGSMFGMPIRYARAFETSFRVPQPDRVPRFRPSDGPLAEQGTDSKAWVGSAESWRLAKGYSYDWSGRPFKRHAVPAPYLRRLLYWWLTALENGTSSVQSSLETLADGSGRP